MRSHRTIVHEQSRPERQPILVELSYKQNNIAFEGQAGCSYGMSKGKTTRQTLKSGKTGHEALMLHAQIHILELARHVGNVVEAHRRNRNITLQGTLKIKLSHIPPFRSKAFQ